MAVATAIKETVERASWIRKMFEEGARLKAEYGQENVYDFSLGNPDLPPPPEFSRVLRQVASEESPGVHGYMANAGYEETRAAVAEQVSREQGVELAARHVIMTCGAAGGLNCVFKTLLDPGDEVIVTAPYFVEYGFYVGNHGGSLKVVPSTAEFSLDLEQIRRAINPRTKAVLLNSPNNPTGQVYDSAAIAALSELLEEQRRVGGKTIYLVTDEPYRKIVYDGVQVPSIFSAYRHSVLVSSYSKDLSLPGERIGYIAVHPEAEEVEMVLQGLILANRILGFVNAPALMQRVVGRLQGVKVDVAVYRARRDLLCEALDDIGYRFVLPKGAFYLFPQSPIGDDVEFCRLLQEERILAVPGSGFGGPGHFRISYCVGEDVIRRSLPGFRRAWERAVR